MLFRSKRLRRKTSISVVQLAPLATPSKGTKRKHDGLESEQKQHKKGKSDTGVKLGHWRQTKDKNDVTMVSKSADIWYADIDNLPELDRKILKEVRELNRYPRSTGLEQRILNKIC